MNWGVGDADKVLLSWLWEIAGGGGDGGDSQEPESWIRCKIVFIVFVIDFFSKLVSVAPVGLSQSMCLNWFQWHLQDLAAFARMTKLIQTLKKEE